MEAPIGETLHSVHDYPWNRLGAVNGLSADSPIGPHTEKVSW